MDHSTSSPVRVDQVVFSFGPDGLVWPEPDKLPAVEASSITLRSTESRIALLVNDRFAASPEVTIFEWIEYLIKGTGLNNVRLPGATVDELDDHLYRFSLKNQVGRLRLALRIDHQWHHLPLLVLSNKFPTVVEHQQFFEILLTDLIKRSAVLPFLVSQPTAFDTDESPEPPTLLFVYHFLRRYGADLQTALQTILGNPHRALVYENRLQPLAQATQVDGGVLQSIISHPQYLVHTKAEMPLTKALAGYGPSHLWQQVAEETFDTAPNRFARHFLMELNDWSSRLKTTNWLTRHLTAVKGIQDELAYAQLDPLWQEVGTINRFPAENQVLLKRFGYRDWADLWRQFQRARLPVFQQTDAAIDTRDIATLYEVWCFFALSNKIQQTLQIVTEELSWGLHISDEKGLEYTTTVDFGRSGYRLSYNERFGRNPTRSYSVTLRPDFTLHGPAGQRIIFDAKFRFDRGDLELDNLDSGDSQRVAKKADLYKMHTYRDALHARAAITLFPGDKDVFYHSRAERVEVIDWPALIAGEWQGIGAVGLVPEPPQPNSGA